MILIPYPVILPLKSDSPLDAVRVIPESVGQFTGYTDGSSNEIFEGDYVHYDCSVYKVIFFSARYLFESISGTLYDLSQEIISDSSAFTVIGNETDGIKDPTKFHETQKQQIVYSV